LGLDVKVNICNFNTLIIKSMKYILSAAAIALLSITSVAQNSYRYFVNFNNVEKDELVVALSTPKVDSEKIEFHMPKIVPGTYEIYDFGRFISNFRAEDSLGNKLTHRKLDDNRYEINNAKKLARITYRVEDTFDTKKGNKVFEPGGTNIEEGKNFVMNTFGVFGYLDGMKDLPFHLECTQPEGFYGATALTQKKIGKDIVEYSAPNYFELTDSPFMLNKPDTINIDLNGTDVVVSVYSPNGVMKANDIREDITNIMFAQKAYLGGSLPVDHYAILIYLFEGRSGSGASGALEHSYSTLFSLPELDAKTLSQSIKDVTAHEFFHIVTPLNIHSEHIHDYDFINPSMSQHLWLYEGSTEYAAQHMQATAGMFEFDEFLSVMRSKINSSTSIYNDTLPFTVMSKGALDEHQSQYGNVYEKGALISMCLDILLIDLSNGEKNLRWLLNELSKEYGKHKAFEDDKLFDIIEKMTYPEVREFLDKYVGGNQVLPLTESFGKVGVNFARDTNIVQLNLGAELKPNPFFGVITVSKITDEKLAKKCGIAQGNFITSINGEELNANNYLEVMGKVKDKEKITIGVGTFDGGQLNSEDVKVKAKLAAAPVRNFIEAKNTLLDKEQKNRDAWLKN
jgi:predicted metalloprotease with PDZ domain